MDTTATLPHPDRLPGPRGEPPLGNALELGSLRLHRQLQAKSPRDGSSFKSSIGVPTQPEVPVLPAEAAVAR
ncbi:MAG TPA: hypothetical protein VEZ89_16380 [Rubrivivax sp.]|nr:hypothetical protein [Rubrivivax sp.]